MSTPSFAVAYTAPDRNAHDAPTLNVLGMACGVKLSHAQSYGQFSCIEVALEPRQFGPPPHVHYQLDEIMRVLEGTVTVLEGDQIREIPAGGWHFRPRGVVHTFWNGHDQPARFIDMYPSSQDFAHYLEELADLGRALHDEGADPFAPESIARFKALDARYHHEVFYDQMPEHLRKYGPKA
ncbi:MAG: cupin domain-containing protein [Sphingobacteriaceae bacterium]|nr:cupin domain-containing protein [Cytophagaceae bacterium]